MLEIHSIVQSYVRGRSRLKKVKWRCELNSRACDVFAAARKVCVIS